jgi:hypothetical protein
MTPPSFLVLVEDYLAMRRDLGFDADKLRWLLRDFALRLGPRPHRATSRPTRPRVKGIGRAR